MKGIIKRIIIGIISFFTIVHAIILLVKVFNYLTIDSLPPSNPIAILLFFTIVIWIVISLTMSLVLQIRHSLSFVPFGLSAGFTILLFAVLFYIERYVFQTQVVSRYYFIGKKINIYTLIVGVILVYHYGKLHHLIKNV